MWTVFGLVISTTACADPSRALSLGVFVLWPSLLVILRSLVIMLFFCLCLLFPSWFQFDYFLTLLVFELGLRHHALFIFTPSNKVHNQLLSLLALFSVANNPHLSYRKTS